MEWIRITTQESMYTSEHTSWVDVLGARDAHRFKVRGQCIKRACDKAFANMNTASNKMKGNAWD
jgi:hypothetical protein